jgi:SAM-dependent methyltransferase
LDRREKALHFADLAGRGLEIGPSYSPLVPKASGANVEVVDHADQATLIEKYRGYGLAPELVSQIEPVDHVWHGGSLLDLLPDRAAFAYIVASHFIEHTVDLIQFLQDCEALLAADGRLALVVPDKRYCFDRFQPLTSVGDVVDAHHGSLAFHTPGSLLDHQAYASKRGDDSIAWDVTDRRPLSLQFPQLEGAREVIENGLKQEGYEDIHRWKFTPASFALLIRDLRTLGYHDFDIVGGFDTAGFEFYVTLGRGTTTPADSSFDRAAALLDIERELASVTVGASNTVDANGSRAVEAELADVYSSTSWRVTRPLRALSTMLRRVRRR